MTQQNKSILVVTLLVIAGTTLLTEAATACGCGKVQSIATLAPQYATADYVVVDDGDDY